MEVNEGDQFELKNFRPTMANKSKLEVCLYFFPINKHVSYFFHLGFSLDKVKILRNIKSKPCATFSAQ